MKFHIIRFFDLFFSILALIVFLPLFLIVGIVLKFTGEGKIFYRQTRIGQYGKRFKLLKFATMKKNSPFIGSGELTIPDDPRVFPFGRFLRKSKINELPQLINVMIGQMSIIGPRPQTEQYFGLYLPEQQRLISSVKPGLSGVGSIIFSDEESILVKVEDPIEFDRNVIMPYKAEVECWFVKNLSLKLYFELIAITVIRLLFYKSNIRKALLSRLPGIPPELKDLI